jgi:hypothetical protein
VSIAVISSSPIAQSDWRSQPATLGGDTRGVISLLVDLILAELLACDRRLMRAVGTAFNNPRALDQARSVSLFLSSLVTCNLLLSNTHV